MSVPNPPLSWLSHFQKTDANIHADPVAWPQPEPTLTLMEAGMPRLSGRKRLHSPGWLLECSIHTQYESIPSLNSLWGSPALATYVLGVSLCDRSLVSVIRACVILVTETRLQIKPLIIFSKTYYAQGDHCTVRTGPTLLVIGLVWMTVTEPIPLSYLSLMQTS